MKQKKINESLSRERGKEQNFLIGMYAVKIEKKMQNLSKLHEEEVLNQTKEMFSQHSFVVNSVEKRKEEQEKQEEETVKSLISKYAKHSAHSQKRKGSVNNTIDQDDSDRSYRWALLPKIKNKFTKAEKNISLLSHCKKINK